MYDVIYEAEIALCNINKQPLQLKFQNDPKLAGPSETLSSAQNRANSSRAGKQPTRANMFMQTTFEIDYGGVVGGKKVFSLADTTVRDRLQAAYS